MLTAMPAVTGGAQFVASYDGPSGATAVNIVGLSNIGGDFNQSTVNAIASAWIDFVTAFMSDEWSVRGDIEFRDLRTEPYPILFATTSDAAGTDTSDPLPPQVALCVSIQAATGGRRGRGRFYLPGVPDSSVSTGGEVDAGLISATLSDLGDFGIACATVGWIPAVYSRTDGVVRALAVASISGFIDTQRRRMERIDA